MVRGSIKKGIIGGRANKQWVGFVLPADVMDSMAALTKTGLWNQLAKISHALYVAYHFIPFMWRFGNPKTTMPKIEAFFKALHSHEAKNLPIGTAGFCWGAKFVVQLCWDQTKTDDGRRLVDCGFVAHPSFWKYPGDPEMVVLPLSVAAAEIDPQMSKEQAQQTKEILTAKTAKTKDAGVEHEFIMYDGAEHGFAVRANEVSKPRFSCLVRHSVDSIHEQNEKHQAEQGKKAEDQAVKWFSRWFANPPPLAKS